MKNVDSVDRSAMILAGGDGTRLRVLTDQMAGGPRPKQFCALLGPESLLSQTRRRVEHLVPAQRTFTVVTQSHERFYAPLLADAAPQSVVVQPANRGTAPAILYGLMRLKKQFDDCAVAVFPSDHYVSDDAAFMNHVRVAFDAVELWREAVVLLGAQATRAETGYGWIEPGGRLGLSPLYHVRKFWEKPSPQTANALWHDGCLWNTFVMVGRVSALLALFASALPDLHGAFQSIQDSLDTSREHEWVERLYGEMGSINFSEQVLAPHAESLSVLPLSGVEWSDIGEVHRIRSILDRAKHDVAANGSPIASHPTLAAVTAQEQAQYRNDHYFGRDHARR